jgi:transcriptional regulator with XRE-family HTH domain
MSNLPSPTELSQAAGISVSYASEILSGKRKPSPALALRIEMRAGVPRHQLRPDIFDPPTLATPLSGGTAGDLAPLPQAPPQGAPQLAGAEPSSAPAAFSGEGAGGVVA